MTSLLLSFSGYAQEPSVPGQVLVTLSFDNTPLPTIFRAIEKQTHYSFVYNNAWGLQNSRSTIHVTRVPLERVLQVLFNGHPFNYELIRQMILVTPVNKDEPRAGSRTGAVTYLSGKILNLAGEPIAGANIVAMGSGQETSSDNNGTFRLTLPSNDSLRVSYVGYRTEQVPLAGRKSIVIRLETVATELIQVVVATGYQKQTIEKLTGSYGKVNNELLNYKVSTNILDRLDGVTSGMVFNPGVIKGNATNVATMSIRGRSTIFANPEPLIILDNFPYSGDVNNINPNDVESITVLKDAAAASIWGAYAANGVIVITSKTGRYKQAAKLSVNANVTVGARPDLFYEPGLGAADYIEIEKLLFSKDAYLSRESDPGHPALSPAVEILIQQRDGLLSPDKANSLLESLKQYDIRKEQEKYLYRVALKQQYAISTAGGGDQNQYYFSAGYDRNLGNEVGNRYNRFTLTGNNSYAWWNKRVELTTGIIFSASDARNPNTTLSSNIPYTRLKDDNGRASDVYLDLRKSYTDTAGGGRLLDWTYKPLEELGMSDNKRTGTDYRINAGLKVRIASGLLINFLYQFNRGYIEQNNYYSPQTYYTRNLINRFTQIDGNTIIRPIPLGGILDRFSQSYQAHNFRTQLDYNKTWNAQHTLAAFGGIELRSFSNQEKNDRQYGFDKARQTNGIVDYMSTFPSYTNPFYEQKIPNLDKSRRYIDRYLSYFTNLAYSFRQRYTISASARKDESNIFGVKTNQKGVPLWSAGFSWELSKEPFYHQSNWLPYLRTRVTHGYNGNVDRSVSAFTTALLLGQNTYGSPSGSILNPPNPALRWEKVRMTNFGIDFASLHNTVSGSIEGYFRKSLDLIGNSPLDPTTGASTLRSNSANMKGKGVDLTINTQLFTNRNFKWNSYLTVSYTTDEITRYLADPLAIGQYLNPDVLNPLKGRPVYAIYSLPWRGLDPTNGDPQGVLNGQVTKDYQNILSSVNFGDLIYNGPASPTFFGGFRNSIGYRGFLLSFNITWKAGYYFRRPSIDYSELNNFNFRGHSDINLRWQKPGDEQSTHVPSFQFPDNSLRNLFYRYSDVLVEKGDHIRLQDVRLQYDLGYNALKKLPFQTFQLYIYANNLGLLWKANHAGIDPDYVSPYPMPFTICGGVKVDIK